MSATTRLDQHNNVRAMFMRPGEFGSPSIRLKDNLSCPYIETGITGGVIEWRRDGDVYCSFGTDPNYRVVVDPSCIERIYEVRA